MSAPEHFVATIGANVEIGRSHYGEIGLSQKDFATYVWGITCKHVKHVSDECIPLEFAKKLHLRDLYLTCGCVCGYERAWKILDASYRKFVTDLVHFCYRQGTDDEEIADTVLVSLYLPDRSGQQRIASYDGRSALATWLRVIVVNRAINQRHEQRMMNEESAVDLPDLHALANLEYELHADRYQEALADCLSAAFAELSAREKLMLLWRYEHNMQLGEIAKLLGIHQSNVTRQLEKLQARLRDAVTCLLSSRYHLSPAAITECLRGTAENPRLSISLLDLIRQIPKPQNAVRKSACG